MATTDPPAVRSHDDHLLRRFVAARTAGDPVAMNRCWGELLTVRMDWLKLAVQLEAKGRLSAHERDEAVQGAAMRIAVNLQRNFKGTSMGQWVNAARTVVHFACIDAMEDAIRARKDQSALDGDSYGSVQAKREAQDAADAEAAEAAQERLDARLEAVQEYLPQLSEKRRIVVEHDLRGAGVDEIRAALGGATREVVYTTRLRAYNDLKKLMRTDES